jgi:hypothetical protein
MFKMYDELLSLLYRYYPKGCAYTGGDYKMSTEYFRYIEVISELNKRAHVSESLLSNIAKSSDGYCVAQREHSDYSNYPSIHYTVLLHKNHPLLDDDVDLILALGGKRLDLELYFSLLGEYYYYYVIETIGGEDTSEWKFSVLSENQLLIQERELISLLRSKVCSLGYKLLEHNLAHEIVPEVETELTICGEATFFNCLFTDMVTNY